MSLVNVLAFIIGLPFVLIKLALYTLFGIIRSFVPMSIWRKKSVEGEVCLITGAGSGIGRQIAINFAEQGADLVLWDVDSAGNKETAQLVRKFGVNVWTYTCDVSNRQKVYTLAQRVKDEAGTVTILVNNAGIVSGSYFLDLSDEKIMKTMGVNTMAHFWTLRAFLPDMIKNNQGHVVTVSSLVGEGGIGGMSDYSASKCAVKGLHESILRELHMYRSNVKCTVVCPYTVNTGMFNGLSVKYQFLLPFITPEYVGKKVVQAVLTDTDTLYLPPYIFIAVFLMHSLPTNVQLAIENFLNANEAMKSFVGKR